MKRLISVFMILLLTACTTVESEQEVKFQCQTPATLEFNIKGLKPTAESECFFGELSIIEGGSDKHELEFCANSSSQEYDFKAEFSSQPNVFNSLHSSVGKRASISFVETLNYLREETYIANFNVDCFE
ncbi:hypothetical protein [Vibrio tasmaniensis]|uniref:hypothetical protein n=1 Tax=Vibrio tasmaniensis TaxID=212663 RepID=UPI00111BA4E1|nr:hypothetical protein [Vibrio tasmaniensis]